jgi:hypothetical protein
VSAPAADPAAPELGPYRVIIEHAELELAHAGRGEIDELAALGARWEQLIAELPRTPPRSAGPLLERAALMHERTRIELIRLREAVLVEHTATTRAQRAAAGYSGEHTRAQRLDRSA